MACRPLRLDRVRLTRTNELISPRRSERGENDAPGKRVTSRLALGGLVASLAILMLAGILIRNALSPAIADSTLGRSELLSGAEVLKSGGLNLTKEQAGIAANRFSLANTHFAHAHNLLTHGPLIGGVRAMPWIGNQVRAAADITDLGAHLARSGGLLVEVVSAASAAGPPGATQAKGSPGQKALAALDALDSRWSPLTQELNAAAADRARIPRAGLLPQLVGAVAQLDSKGDVRTLPATLADLRKNEPAIRQLLGAAGPQSYLVLQQDPAELRATGGFIGSLGFLNFDRGKLAPYQPTDVYAIDNSQRAQRVLGPPGTPGHVDVPYPLEHEFHLPSLTLRDSNWSPDFPTAGQQAEYLLERETGQRVEGVIAVDPYFIQRVLSVVGPTIVPETGDVVDQNNFFETTLRRVELTDGRNPNRKGFLSLAGKAIFARVLEMPAEKWPAMLRAIQWGCESRSVQAFFHDAALESFIDRQNCGGMVRPTSSDGVMVVESNIGGNKDDFWMKRNYSLQISLNQNGTARHSLNLHYFGLTPQGPLLTEYVGYTGWLRVYLPSSASIVSVSGTSLNSTTDLGRRVLEGWFYVKFYSTADINIVYDVSSSSMDVQNRHARFFWQKQAGRPGDAITVSFVPPAGSTLRAVHLGRDAVPTGMVSSDLAIDREFAFDYRP